MPNEAKVTRTEGPQNSGAISSLDYPPKKATGSRVQYQQRKQGAWSLPKFAQEMGHGVKNCPPALRFHVS